jgi:hypothetical protein
MSKLPQTVKVCLWSYDTTRMKLSSPQYCHRIVLNVLNLGTEEAVQWLWQNVSDKEIKEVIKKSYGSEWNKKSLNLWSMFYKVKPEKMRRFPDHCK